MGPVQNVVPAEKIRRLASDLLLLAADHFANHGCNDFARPEYFTDQEWEQLSVDYERWNSNGRDPASPLGDWVAMNWCAMLLEAGLI